MAVGQTSENTKTIQLNNIVITVSPSTWTNIAERGNEMGLTFSQIVWTLHFVIAQIMKQIMFMHALNMKIPVQS